ncbi:MAG: cytochrome c biogenesis protein CcsA [Coriobacteriales bacterium]|jgi:cytochrome c-type biogenesis protein CcmF|nr:cytochrome c biogenesis protein CcsA [Coriobacteriales bacterium]
MPIFGSVSLFVAFAATAISVVVLFLAVPSLKSMQHKSGSAQLGVGNDGQTKTKSMLQLIGYGAVIIVTLTLTICCAILIVGFLSGDISLEYVVRYHSDSSTQFAWLYKLAGLWAGREGSLLFWAWLISVFNLVIALRTLKRPAALDCAALGISQIVLLAFIVVLTFADGNMPFVPLAAEYVDANGELTGVAALWGMNTLLEHWAMAIHPPTLFVGYAGLTIPFAYAVAALIANDSSKNWVKRCERFTLISWLFLGIGIGLGAVWAYVVLGWGGYWGWDPVENASLLSWVIGVALIHSLTVYRQRGIFKRWAVMCACLTFAFVIVGTFISRSGIVQSVHAFEANAVSTILFGALIIFPVLVGGLGLILRRKSFAPAVVAGELSEETDSMFTKDVAYYLNNIVMLVCTIILAYMTISSALPEWLPAGGTSIPASAYNFIARPVGVLYCLIIAICPLLAWGKTDRSAFFKAAKIPAICAIVVFLLLMVYFFTYLAPTYYGISMAGGSAAENLKASGPWLLYAAITVVGFFVASLLLFNSLFMLGRNIKKGVRRVQMLGGFLAHAAMAIILVGLIGSSMYVTERAGYMSYDEEKDVAGAPFKVRDYTLSYVGSNIELQENGDDVLYTVTFDVKKGDTALGQVAPAVQVVQSTQQQKLIAGVISLPLEDLFVVYKGVNNEGAFSLDVRVNPLISFVWAGFVLLMLGTAIAAFGRR